MPVLAIAVGIYLPISSTAPIFLGGLLAHLTGRAMKKAGRSEEEQIKAGRRGLLFASGIITGETLIGIALAIPFAIYENQNAWNGWRPRHRSRAAWCGLLCDVCDLDVQGRLQA